MRRAVDLHGGVEVRSSGFERFQEGSENGWRCRAPPGTLDISLRGRLSPGQRLVLSFLRHDWSGKVEVEAAGNPAVKIDLFDPVVFHNFLVPLPVGVTRVKLVASGERFAASAGSEVWLRGAVVSDEETPPNWFPKLLVNDEAANGTQKWDAFWTDGASAGEGCGGWPYRLPYLEAFRQILEETGSRSILELGAQSGRWISYFSRYLDADLSPQELLRAHRDWSNGGFLLLAQARRPSPRYELAIADCSGGAIRAAIGRMPWVHGFHIPDFGLGLGEIPDKSYDVVFAFQTVEHVFAVETLLREALRVARKYLICSTPFEENPHALHPVRLDQHRLRRFFVEDCSLRPHQVTFADDHSSANVRRVAPNSRFWCVRVDPSLPDPWERLLSPRALPSLFGHVARSCGRVVGRRLAQRA